MKSKIIFSLALTAMVLLAAGTAWSAILNVDNTVACSDVTGTPYCTIQAAVTAAGTGDTINVAAGTYNEDVTVNKSLTLNGAQVGVDARGRSASESEVVGVVKVTSAATNVVFDGFKFTSPTRGFTPRGFNLHVESEDSTIENCIFVAEVNAGHTYAGYLDFGGITNTTVERNSFSGDLDPVQDPNVILLGITGAGAVRVADNEMHDVGGGGGVGIMCSNDSAVISIEDNEIDNTGDGIWIWPYADKAFSVSITGNDIYGCEKDGVKVLGGCAGDVTINCNNIYNNNQGVVNGCVDSVLSVDAEHNWWGAANGPSGSGTGSGDSVSDNVDFDPWMTTPVDGVCPPPAYTCVGFDPPVHEGAVKVKKNRVIPFKAALLDQDGYAVTDSDISAPPVIQVMYSSGTGPAVDATDDALSVGFGTEGNEFEFRDGKWQFNLKTKNYSAPGTYTVTMVSGNSSEYIIDPACTATFVIE